MSVISLDDLDTVSDSSQNNDSDSSSSDSSDELREVCEQLGADYEHASSYVDVHGNKDDLISFAEALIDNDSLRTKHENYRQGNDIHRIIVNHLRGEDGDFTPYTSVFYGDSDNPDEGTYNYVQQTVRSEENGNLIFYKALFPEPDTDYWDSNAVLWHEFDELQYSTDSSNQIDAHIYVSEEWVSEYSDFSIEVGGEERPRPPSEAEMASDGGTSSSSDVSTSDAPFDPADFTIDELKDVVSDTEYTATQFRHALNMEKENKQRKGAKDVLRDAHDEAEERSPAAEAGEANSVPDIDIDPDKYIKLAEKGLSKEEIIEMFG